MAASESFQVATKLLAVRSTGSTRQPMGMTSFYNWIEAVKRLPCHVSNFRPWLHRVHERGAKAALIVYAPTSKVARCLCEL